MQWHSKTFAELSTLELYQILKLRVDVFVVEQECAYPDIDNLDLLPQTIHLFATQNEQVIAYLRILAPANNENSQVVFGRVATSQAHRSRGLGHELVIRALSIIDNNWGQNVCHISAQSHLQAFYQKHGFKPVGKGYLEDGIPHIGMER
ncbi:GNAT family N-acetyltransferase [Aliikangiella sp. IMCC44653]